MKVIFLNLLILIAILLLIYIGIFDFIASKYFQIFAFALVIIMFVIGFFVIGNPFNDKKK